MAGERTKSSLLSQNLTVWSWPTLAMKERSNVLRNTREGANGEKDTEGIETTMLMMMIGRQR